MGCGLFRFGLFLPGLDLLLGFECLRGGGVLPSSFIAWADASSRPSFTAFWICSAVMVWMGVSGAGPYAATWSCHSLDGPPNCVKSAIVSKLGKGSGFDVSSDRR
jgi:hypothetical protein